MNLNLSPKQIRLTVSIGLFTFISILVGYHFKSLLHFFLAFGGLLIVYGLIVMGVDWAKIRSPGLIIDIGSGGHTSIRACDRIRVGSPIDGEPGWLVIAAGGSDVIEAPFRGFGPFFVCPEELPIETNAGTIIIADWFRVKFEQLEPEFQEALTYHAHFNPLTSEIYYAETSMINGTSTQKNIELLEKCRRYQETINSLKKDNQELNKALRSRLLLEKEVRNANQNVKIVTVPVNNKE